DYLALSGVRDNQAGPGAEDGHIVRHHARQGSTINIGAEVALRPEPELGVAHAWSGSRRTRSEVPALNNVATPLAGELDLRLHQDRTITHEDVVPGVEYPDYVFR